MIRIQTLILAFQHLLFRLNLENFELEGFEVKLGNYAPPLKPLTLVVSTSGFATLLATKTRHLKLLMIKSKPIKVQRIDLSICLTRLFCQNSEYENPSLIQRGVNLEKNTTVKILKVFQLRSFW